MKFAAVLYDHNRRPLELVVANTKGHGVVVDPEEGLGKRSTVAPIPPRNSCSKM
jgi:hypothetical protein